MYFGIQLIFQGGFFSFNLQVCISSIFSFAGLGTHFRAPKHVYMKWNKGEEVSGKKNNLVCFGYTYCLEWWSSRGASGTIFSCQLHIPVYFVVPFSCCIFFVLNVHKPLHLSYWVCWIVESCACVSEKKISSFCNGRSTSVEWM